MYLIDKNAELTPVVLGRILNQFQTTDLPVLKKYYDYYKGKQAITHKTASDLGKPCNQIVTNYCSSIVNSYLGYLSGVAIQYSNDEADISAILDVLNYNDVKSEDTELLRQALIFGRAFEICYVDEEGKQRFRTLDARSCVPIYDNTLTNNLLYVVRFWREDLVEKNDEIYMVEVYGPNTVKRYRSTGGFISFTFLEEVPHYFKQCPITVFSLNTEEDSIFADIMTLQDSYNALLSSEVDDFESFCDAYLLMKGVIADDEDLDDMKRHRVLMMDADADASYLTKNISDTQIVNMLQRVNENIHKVANCPDFSQESFGTSSGIALRYRLLGFENNASGIESNMKKALQRRIELICSILTLTGGEEMWREVNIVINRNLPVNIDEIAQFVNQLRGLVSDETLLTQIPFVTDVKAELKKLAEQRAVNMSLYGFNNTEEKEEEVVDA